MILKNNEKKKKKYNYFIKLFHLKIRRNINYYKMNLILYLNIYYFFINN